MDELGGMGASYFDLTFDGYVAQDRPLDKIPEVLHRIAEITWDVHVIVYGEAFRTPPECCVEERRLADLSAKSD